MLKCAESVMKHTLEVIDTEKKFRATFFKVTKLALPAFANRVS